MAEAQRIILHHYPMSPFAEKIRLIMGAKGVQWSSVLIPVIMPKPDVVALTGGYRKTPILQIGADIFWIRTSPSQVTLRQCSCQRPLTRAREVAAATR